MTEVVDYDSLNVLLKASSKELVLRLCNQAFLYRDLIQPPAEVVHKVAEGLTASEGEASKLLRSLGNLIRNVLYIGCTDATSVQAVFPSDFHKNLKDLLTRIFAENLTTWRNRSVNSQISLPRLVDFDWRVDIKTSSDTLARMSVPTCVLQLKVQENPTRVDTAPETSTMNVELSKETLDTMLDGLGKIRDQLNSVAQK
ncbi:COMM domain-containing protein 9-like [Acanthaster planci]|uniref:COMM domain-containing protein 9-like n=1 Tax=Acanthaster planci TaxID=133434 RepID=A0A8B7XSB4_ACAPL|nr:COMM domain-containing protein 9-like [Acanthaster planci]